VLGVRRRPAAGCAGVMVAIIAYPGSPVDICRTSLHSYSTTFYRRL
jgi:hypothetical protein